MKKRLFIAIACCLLVVACSVTLVVLGIPKTKTESITKADLVNYISETATMHFDKGYKANVAVEGMTGYVEVAKNGQNFDIKLLSNNNGEDNAIYVKDGEGFTKTKRSLEKMDENLLAPVVAQASAPILDYASITQSLLAPETTEVVKTTTKNQVTYTYVDQVAGAYDEETFEPDPSVRNDINMELVFVNDALVKIAIDSVNPNEFAYSYVYEEFAGPVDFSGVDFDNYVKTFNLGNVTVTLTNKFVQQTMVPGGADFYLLNQDIAFITQHEDISASPDAQTMTAAQYASAWNENLTATNHTFVNDTENNLVYVKYNIGEADEMATYLAFAFKGSNNIFYMCQFVCYQSEFSSLESQIIQWAKTITVA